MKWHKMRYNEKANTHRNGWKFWDLLDSDDLYLCTVRFIPDKPLGFCYDILPAHDLDRSLIQFKFDTLKKAQDHCVAHFVNKRLEESNG